MGEGGGLGTSRAYCCRIISMPSGNCRMTGGALAPAIENRRAGVYPTFQTARFGATESYPLARHRRECCATRPLAPINWRYLRHWKSFYAGEFQTTPRHVGRVI